MSQRLNQSPYKSLKISKDIETISDKVSPAKSEFHARFALPIESPTLTKSELEAKFRFDDLLDKSYMSKFDANKIIEESDELSRDQFTPVSQTSKHD